MTVTLDDVAAELGVVVPESGSPEIERWQLWINDASEMVADVVSQRGLDSFELGNRADRVVRLMVARALRNPDGATSVSEQVSVDDGSATETRRFDGATAPGMVLSDDLLAYLFGARRASGFGSIRVGVPAWRQPRCGL